MDTGNQDEARTALAEARTLDETAPEIAELERRLARGGEPPPPPSSTKSWRWAFALTTIVIVGGVGFFAWSVTRATVEPPAATSTRKDLTLAPDGTAARSFTTTHVIQETVTARTEVPEIVGTAGDLSNLATAPLMSTRQAPDATPAVEQRAEPPMTSLEPAQRVVSALESTAMPAPVQAPEPTRSAPEPLPPPAADTATPATTVPAVHADEREHVLDVLTRYEAAYSRLDAAAARAVWPAVDQKALARAFQGLAWQRVSLGRCDVRVEGVDARADCAGTATWTPRIGGGGFRTQPRRWTFLLKNPGTGWQITSASVR